MKVTPKLLGRPVHRIHAIGACGMGLGPLAVYLASAGFEVSAEDDAEHEAMRAQLDRAGVRGSALPDKADLVVRSSAVGMDHPSVRRAVERGIPVARRGELLAEVVKGRRLVAVCGSHGKTTTTAMLVVALRRAGFPAGHILGGLLADGSAPGGVGEGDWVVAELDESDGTIAGFAPEITVVVNLDWDHPDQYPQVQDLVTAFAELIRRTRGSVLVSDTCPISARLAPAGLTFGRSGRYRARLAEETAGGMVLRLGGEFPPLEIAVQATGEFNAANATAALAAAQLMGANLTPGLLGDFPGVLRRQTRLSTADRLTVLEDYAHHPSEIRALLASLRAQLADSGNEGRLIVVFQPHRYSRTAQFKAEFAGALASADRLHLLDVYGAGESPQTGGTTADIYAELKRQGMGPAVSYLPGGDHLLFAALDAEVRPGDWVAFVGAGDIDRKARAWLAQRSADHPAGDPAAAWDSYVAAVRPHLASESRLTREEPLGTRTTMRVGGAARVYAEPANREDLARLWREARSRGLPIFLLGRGSNLIIPDTGVEGVVVALHRPSWSTFEVQEDGRVRVGAGLRLKQLCGFAASAGLTGFEFLEGIPGTVGGALRMNAGAMGGWMFDRVEQVEVLTAEGEYRLLPREALHVDYRFCRELRGSVAVGAVLKSGQSAAPTEINQQVDVYRRKRQESQPREPSAGCIFKNPPGHSAGRLIDEAGLKGTRVGGAEVSAVHANFIVNRGGATAADVIALMRRVREQVWQARGVELEPEVLLLGGEWKEVLQPKAAGGEGGHD